MIMNGILGSLETCDSAHVPQKSILQRPDKGTARMKLVPIYQHGGEWERP